MHEIVNKFSLCSFMTLVALYSMYTAKPQHSQPEYWIE